MSRDFYDSKIVPLLLGGIALVMLFFIGLGIGLIAGAAPEAEVEVSVFVDHPDDPGDVEPEVILVPDPYPVERPYPVPVPYAIADERLGAYRVNGYVTLRGHGPYQTIGRTRQKMACFPL